MPLEPDILLNALLLIPVRVAVVSSADRVTWIAGTLVDALLGQRA